jgi:hypothetical protein
MENSNEKKTVKAAQKKKRSAILYQAIFEIVLIASTIAILAAAGFPGGLKLLVLIFGGYAVRILLIIILRIKKWPFNKSGGLFSVIW